MNVILRNGQVWQKSSFEKMDLLISDGKIRELGQMIPKQQGTEEMDLTGYYILPGLIDCHWHIGMAGDDPQTEVYYRATPMQGAYRSAGYARRLLYGGFTTVRECGSMFSETAALRDAIRAGDLEGPRLLVCGRALRIPGGHMPCSLEVSGPEEARRAAREQLAQGADFLKVMLTGGLGRTNEVPDTVEMDLDELQAVCREGHRTGKAIACHAHSKRAMMNAILAGATTIEHATMLDAEVVDGLLKNDMAIVPTFAPYGLVARYGERYGVPAEVRESAARLYDIKCERFALAHKQGVKILYGRDVFLIEPENAAEEMLFMQQAGMSAAEVIRSATDLAAKELGLGQETGSLEAGKCADLLVLSGDPLKDLRYFDTALTAVMKDGRWAAPLARPNFA